MKERGSSPSFLCNPNNIRSRKCNFVIDSMFKRNSVLQMCFAVELYYNNYITSKSGLQIREGLII